MFALIQTGIGTQTVISMYFGPFEGQDRVEEFADNARNEYGKFVTTCVMMVRPVTSLPDGIEAIDPRDFMGFECYSELEC